VKRVLQTKNASEPVSVAIERLAQLVTEKSLGVMRLVVTDKNDYAISVWHVGDGRVFPINPVNPFDDPGEGPPLKSWELPGAEIIGGDRGPFRQPREP
jgi:hypothetical protein